MTPAEAYAECAAIVEGAMSADFGPSSDHYLIPIRDAILARAAEVAAEPAMTGAGVETLASILREVVMYENGCDQPGGDGTTGPCFVLPGESCSCRTKAKTLEARILAALAPPAPDARRPRDYGE